MLIALLVFVLTASVLGGRYALAVRRINALASDVGGRRLLGRGNLAIETDDCVIELRDHIGWRVEVPRVRLGRRLTMSLVTGLQRGIATGYAEVDGNFRLTADDADLAATVCSDPRVREGLLRVLATIAVQRVDLIVGEVLVVSGRLRRRVDERAAVSAVVEFARALDALHDVKVVVNGGAGLDGGVGGASGAPFAMPLR